LPDEILDCMGQVCPQPLLETLKKLKSMMPGQTLEVFGDFPLSKEEIPAGMKEAGQEVISISEKDGIWHIIIRKTK
jgi:tRNA 2-thiouridine synthesizing protein A